MAPPTVANCVPGVTGSIQPRGMKVRWMSRSSTPASQVSSPVASSQAMKRSCPRVAQSVPPGFRHTSP